jgi:hypothetical protein
MSAVPSSPPPPARAKALQLRAPAVKLRTPSRYRGRVRAAALFDALLHERGIPAIELAETMGVSERIVRQMRSGEVAIGIGDVFTMQRRQALAYLDAVRSALLVANDDSGGGGREHG